MCDDVRLGLSALLDGEAPGSAPEALAAHLAGCAGCREWQGGAARLAEVIGPVAGQAPDLSDRIMAAVARDAAARPGTVGPAPDPGGGYTAELRARQRILQLAVACAAAVQLALVIPALLSAFVGPPVGLHASREMASFDVAVAVGFFFAAARPGQARAFLPVAVVLASCLAVTSGIDIVRGATVFSHEIGHLVVAAQAGLLWALTRTRPAPEDARVGDEPGTGPAVA